MAGPDFQVDEAEGNKILYIALSIGSTVLVGNDVPSFMGKTNENENRSKILVRAESRDEAEKIFAGLSAGGSVEMPMDSSPWGSFFGGLRDKYGVEWEVECSQ